MTKQDFVNTYQQDAQNACSGTNIFPLLALSEGAVESAWGESMLAKQANNLFGVKAYPQYWTGKTITMHTKEYDKDGNPFYIDAEFKAYDSPRDSFADYVKTVLGPRYQAAGVTEAPDPETEITDIAKAGYSTSPTYATLITTIMHELKPLMA